MTLSQHLVLVPAAMSPSTILDKFSTSVVMGLSLPVNTLRGWGFGDAWLLHLAALPLERPSIVVETLAFRTPYLERTDSIAGGTYRRRKSKA